MLPLPGDPSETVLNCRQKLSMFEIGSSLREARMRQKLELSDAERETRIRAKYLRALEDERFQVLPGPAYTKGFLRSYAHYLDLDAQRFVDEYNTRFPPRRSGPLLRSGFGAAGSRQPRGYSPWGCWRRAAPSSLGGSRAPAATTPHFSHRLRRRKRPHRPLPRRRAPPRRRRRSPGSCSSHHAAPAGCRCT